MYPWDAYNLQQDPVFLQFLFFCLIYYGELKNSSNHHKFVFASLPGVRLHAQHI